MWKIGDIILDLYEVQEAYTGGGMGVVYKVYNRNWHIPLAVKSPRAEFFESQVQKDNFIRECETWINLGLHPNIVSCYYVREIDGIPRVFCEFIEGGSLKDWITDKRLYEGNQEEVLARMLDIAIQFAWGLQYAHEANLVHQDVKPANVMLREDGTPLVTDFGLAKAKGISGQSIRSDNQQSISVTSGGYTPAYCSPEQFSEQPVTRKTDIWSWAVSILEMFTGEIIWQGGQLAGGSLDVVLKEGTQRSDIPTMPSELGTLLQKCLQYKAEDRPTGMQEISEELQRIYQSVTGKSYPRKYPQAAEIDAGSLNNRAISYLDLGKEAEAEKLFQEALTKHPGHLDTTYNYGIWMWKNFKGDDYSLLKQLEACGESTYAPGMKDLLTAKVHISRRDIPSALSHLELSKRKNCKDSEYEILLKQAISLKDQAITLIQTFPEKKRILFESICFSSDGILALSGDSDSLKLWDITTGTCISTFEGHSDSVESVCFSPDGKLALSGGEDKTIKLWDISTGQCLRTFEVDFIINSVCFHPNGKFILSSGESEFILVWDIITAELVLKINGHTDEDIIGDVGPSCFSPDGKMVLSGSYDTLQLWDFATGKRIRKFEEQNTSVESVCFSPDGKLALTGSYDAKMKLWDVKTGRCLRTYIGHKGSVNSVCFNPNGDLSLSGSSDNTIKLWNLMTGQCLRTFDEHTKRIISVCFSPDGKLARSGSGDKTIKSWNLKEIYGKSSIKLFFHISNLMTYITLINENEQLTQVISSAKSALTDKKYSEAIRLVNSIQKSVRGERNEVVRQIKIKLSQSCSHSGLSAVWKKLELKGHKGSVNTVCFSQDGKLALSGSSDRTNMLWDVITGQCIQTFEGNASSKIRVSFSPNGKLAVLGGFSGRFKLLDISTGQCIREFITNTRVVKDLCFSPDGRRLLSGGSGDSEHLLQIWDVITGDCIQSFGGQRNRIETVCFSPNGKQALTGSYDRNCYVVELWDISTGQAIKSFKGSSSTFIKTICFNPDGTTMLTVQHNTMELWDVVVGKCVQKFTGHLQRITSVCFNPDGKTAVSGSWDKTVKIWDISTGACIKTLVGHTGSINSVCFSPDGWQLLSASNDNTIINWDLDWELTATE